MLKEGFKIVDISVSVAFDEIDDVRELASQFDNALESFFLTPGVVSEVEKEEEEKQEHKEKKGAEYKDEISEENESSDDSQENGNDREKEDSEADEKKGEEASKEVELDIPIIAYESKSGHCQLQIKAREADLVIKVSEEHASDFDKIVEYMTEREQAVEKVIRDHTSIKWIVLIAKFQHPLFPAAVGGAAALDVSPADIIERKLFQGAAFSPETEELQEFSFKVALKKLKTKTGLKTRFINLSIKDFTSSEDVAEATIDVNTKYDFDTLDDYEHEADDFIKMAKVLKKFLSSIVGGLH